MTLALDDQTATVGASQPSERRVRDRRAGLERNLGVLDGRRRVQWDREVLDVVIAHRQLVVQVVQIVLVAPEP